MHRQDSSTYATHACHVVVCLVLLTQASLLAYSATRHSPTHLEPAFLAAGVSHWQFGSFDLYRVNPPLPRMLPGLVAQFVGCETDWSHATGEPGSRPEFIVGDDFAKANGNRIIDLVIYARWACIPFGLLGTYFAFRWATALYGAEAGLATSLLMAFEPNLLAHAELITPDAACTSFGIAAGYAFWNWLRKPTWLRCFGCGVILGLAVLTKFTWLILFAAWPASWLLWRISLRPSGSPEAKPVIKPGRAPLHQLILLLLVGGYVINCGYAFEGSGSSLGSFQFVSGNLSGCRTEHRPANRFRDSILGVLPVPFPENLVLGVDAQMRDFERYHEKSYLRGEWKDDGWWYYYMYGLLVKVPTGILVLLAMVVIGKFRHPPDLKQARDEILLLLPAALVMLIASCQTAFAIHLRYVFPALGFVLIFCGQSVSSQLFGRLSSRILARLLIAYSIVNTLMVYPHQLAYFNEWGGGFANGHLQLLGSSRDWGQDLIELKKWCDRNHVPEIHLAFYSRIHPSTVGLNAVPIVRTRPGRGSQPLLSPGAWLAVSDSILCGKQWVSFADSDGHCFEYDQEVMSELRGLVPVCRVGGSIQVFRIPSTASFENSSRGPQ